MRMIRIYHDVLFETITCIQWWHESSDTSWNIPRKRSLHVFTRLWGALGNIIKETAGALEASVMAHFGRNSRKRRDGKKKRKAKRRCQASGTFFSILQRWELTHWAANIAFQIPRPLATDQMSSWTAIHWCLFCALTGGNPKQHQAAAEICRRRLKNGWNFWISPQDYQFPSWGFIEWDAQIIRFGLWSGNKWWFKQGPPVCGIQYGL